ncbi:MAG: hypothetical protein Q4G07_05030 [Oscillospiraceae bacterium]|nr:hypothetical protein [Oscillospiraceae bacterium]
MGNSWVSETAYVHTRQRVRREEMGRSALQSLPDRLPDTSFSTNTAPFSAAGVHNIAAALHLLRRMENDPGKRPGQEAVTHDCVQRQKFLEGARRAVPPGGSKLIAQGAITE